MDKFEAVQQMQNIINQTEDVVFEEEVEQEEIDIKDDWFATLPQVKDDEFLIPINYQENIIVVCVIELDWYCVQQVELVSYRKRKFTEGNYYAGEYECRETLKKAIIWVADLNEQELLTNNGDILTYLPQELVDLLWGKYYPKISLTAKEANALYSASIAYFKGDVANKPIPPIVIEIDMLIQFGQLSRQEIRQIKNSEMQRIKLIMKARAEVLHPQNVRQSYNIQSSSDMMDQVLNLPDDIIPPGLRGLGKISQ